MAYNGGGWLGLNSYDEYGIPGSGNAGRFQYTGQAWLSETGMYYYKARIYSPTLAPFLQTDPVGYDDEVDLYTYVGDDPINATDPSGTDACTGSHLSCQVGGLSSGSSGFSYGSLTNCNGHISPKLLGMIAKIPPVSLSYTTVSGKQNGAAGWERRFRVRGHLGKGYIGQTLRLRAIWKDPNKPPTSLTYREIFKPVGGEALDTFGLEDNSVRSYSVEATAYYYSGSPPFTGVGYKKTGGAESSTSMYPLFPRPLSNDVHVIFTS